MENDAIEILRFRESVITKIHRNKKTYGPQERLVLTILYL